MNDAQSTNEGSIIVADGKIIARSDKAAASVTFTPQPTLAVLPIQRETRERLLDGMCKIIRRMTRVSAGGILCLVDHDERELAIELFSYLEGVEAHL